MLIAALLVVAAADEPPPPPPELVQAGEAWSACLGGGMQDTDTGTSAAARADALLARCATLQQTVMAEHARWIDGSALSDREKADARRAMTRSLRAMRTRLIAEFRDN